MMRRLKGGAISPSKLRLTLLSNANHRNTRYTSMWMMSEMHVAITGYWSEGRKVYRDAWTPHHFAKYKAFSTWLFMKSYVGDGGVEERGNPASDVITGLEVAVIPLESETGPARGVNGIGKHCY
jgi:hypothetical protein